MPVMSARFIIDQLVRFVVKESPFDQLANYMFDRQVRFLNVLRISARDRDRYVGQSRELSALAYQSDGPQLTRLRSFDRPNHVARIAAGAHPNQDIASLSQGLDLMLEDTFKTEVV